MTIATKQFSTNVGFAWGDRFQGLSDLSIKDIDTGSTVLTVLPVPIYNRSNENYPFNCFALLDISYSGCFVTIHLQSEQTNYSVAYNGFEIRSVIPILDRDGRPTGRFEFGGLVPNVAYHYERVQNSPNTLCFFNNVFSVPVSFNAFALLYMGNDPNSVNRRLSFNSASVSLSPRHTAVFN